jgi:hypothetical protein
MKPNVIAIVSGMTSAATAVADQLRRKKNRTSVERPSPIRIAS